MVLRQATSNREFDRRVPGNRRGFFLFGSPRARDWLARPVDLVLVAAGAHTLPIVKHFPANHLRKAMDRD
jgi:hypothetical protein